MVDKVAKDIRDKYLLFPNFFEIVRTVDSMVDILVGEGLLTVGVRCR